MGNNDLTLVFNSSSAATDSADLARQPALQFERLTGLQNIARPYRFPEGMSGDTFEKTYFWIPGRRPAILDQVDVPESRLQSLTDDVDSLIAKSSPQFTAVLARTWDDLTKLNSALLYVKVDKSSPNQLYDALLGVASSFNTDDINFYLQKRWVEKTSPFQGIAAALDSIEAKVGVRPQWLPSPATLKRIDQQIGLRTQTTAVTAPKPR